MCVSLCAEKMHGQTTESSSLHKNTSSGIQNNLICVNWRCGDLSRYSWSKINVTQFADRCVGKLQFWTQGLQNPMAESSYITLSAVSVDHLGLLNFTRKVQIFIAVRRKLVLLKIKMSTATREWCLILDASTELLYCRELNLNGGKDLLVNTAEEKWDHWESIKRRLESVSTTPCYFIL